MHELFPPWEMPSDPVKAVWWFAHWLLQVLVRYLWVPIAIMVTYELVANTLVDGLGNGIVVGMVTLVIGLVIWAVLYAVLKIVNFWTKISHTISDVQQMQQGMFQGPFSYPFQEQEPYNGREAKGQIVEGSITEIDDNGKQR